MSALPLARATLPAGVALGDDGAAMPQRHRNAHDLLRRILRSGVQQELDRRASELVVREGEGCETRVEPARQLMIVEGDDREVARDVEAGLLDRLVRAEREPVVEGDHGLARARPCR